MPDKRHHRGPNPKDARLFGNKQLPILRRAVHDYAWLLKQGYAAKSALTLVGDHFQLDQRQRVAAARSTCSESEQTLRKRSHVPREQLQNARLLIDGYNVLTTVEAALAGGWVLIGMDGSCRDMASIHGSFKTVDETVPAIELIGETLTTLKVREAIWYLDRPVSNSGRLKKLILAVAQRHQWNWQVELVQNPDGILASSEEIIATADSPVLNRCKRWFNLAGEVLKSHIPSARILDLSVTGEEEQRANTG